MANVPLRFACGLYDRMLALYTGEVKPAGIDFKFEAIDDPRQIFDRMAGGLEFDLCEMSSSEFISRVSAEREGGPRCPFVALPVIASRVFRHSFITVNRKRVKTPKDLEGKRVGVALYTMSAAIWARGHLQHDYGVDLSKIHWVQGALNSAGMHGSPTVLPMVKPPPIEINKSGKSLSQLLSEGGIDAITGAELPDSMKHDPDVVRLFPNYREVEKDYYKRTRIFPIMHLIAIRRELYEKHPFIAASLYKAFVEAKSLAIKKMHFVGALRYMQPWLMADLEEIDEVFGGDCWPYGVEENRPTWSALVTYLHEQGVIAKPIPIEELFLPTGGQPA